MNEPLVRSAERRETERRETFSREQQPLSSTVRENDVHIDLNPETLKQRYGYDQAEGRSFEDLTQNASPTKRKQLSDLVSTLEKEAARTTMQKAEIE